MGRRLLQDIRIFKELTPGYTIYVKETLKECGGADITIEGEVLRHELQMSGNKL